MFSSEDINEAKYGGHLIAYDFHDFELIAKVWTCFLNLPFLFFCQLVNYDK